MPQDQPSQDQPSDVSEALERLLQRVDPVEPEEVPLDASQLAGRMLAEPICLDRDSPACDVSAMDGYAVRLRELEAGPLPLTGECRMGEPPAELAAGEAFRIYTGSPLPNGADTVVRLERANDSDGKLILKADANVPLGADIRRQGENARRGEPALEAGIGLSPAAITALATIGPSKVLVYRRLRVAVLTTGNELVPATDPSDPPPWKLRDSNGPSLTAMLSPAPWIESVHHTHAEDELEPMAAQLKSLVESHDAVVLTGGVSKGAYDYVPEAVERAGGETVFHRLNARPGRPTLGATASGKPIIGLPGNPLAVLTAGRRVLAPALRRRAGLAAVQPPSPVVSLTEWSGKPIPITWWRPVRLLQHGVAELVSLRGSGDTCGPAMSHGFVEIAPGSDSLGPHPFYPWSL